MSRDLYIEKPGGDVATRIRLLVSHGDSKSTVSGYVQLIHGKIDRGTGKLKHGEFNRLIEVELNRLQKLGISIPEILCFQRFPLGSWFLQFTFTLAKPWMSKDDDPFYVAESVNPVRKDKVFKVPFMSAAAWKGLLRWTAMYKRLVLKKEVLSDEDFASERFRQSLLFGDEKGEKPGGAEDFAAFLDLVKPGARDKYRSMTRECFGIDLDRDEMPRHRGRLTFYPSFFNLIDVEVINPHSRWTKAGTHPIYLECVPAGAKGIFSLLYVPFDLIGRKNKEEICSEAKQDLIIITEALSALMLTYGFSAKRTSGYGTAMYNIEGFILTRSDKKKLSSLEHLDEGVYNIGF